MKRSNFAKLKYNFFVRKCKETQEIYQFFQCSHSAKSAHFEISMQAHVQRRVSNLKQLNLNRTHTVTAIYSMAYA